MEVDPLTVFLARVEQESSVGVPVPALVKVGPWGVSSLIHGSIVPDACRRERAKAGRWSHGSIQDSWPVF